MSSQLKFSFLRNWKLGLAVSVPCFVAGLGVSYYYYYSKKSDKTDLLVKSEPVTADKSLVENGNVAAAAAREPQKTDEVTRDPVENRTKVSKQTRRYPTYLCTHFPTRIFWMRFY